MEVQHYWFSELQMLSRAAWSKANFIRPDWEKKTFSCLAWEYWNLQNLWLQVKIPRQEVLRRKNLIFWPKEFLREPAMPSLIPPNSVSGRKKCRGLVYINGPYARGARLFALKWTKNKHCLKFKKSVEGQLNWGPNTVWEFSTWMKKNRVPSQAYFLKVDT